MNAGRRKQIKEIVKQLETIKGMLEDCALDIESVMDEEQEAFDNMPESLQASERGETMEENIGELDDIISELNDNIDLSDIMDRLEAL